MLAIFDKIRIGSGDVPEWFAKQGRSQTVKISRLIGSDE